MRRPLTKLVAVCLLLLGLVSPRPAGTPPPVVTPTRSTVAQQDALARAIRQKFDEQALADFYAAVSATTTTTTVRARRAARSQEVVYGTGACGGDLPPCSVMMCESGGNIRAQNPRSTASGKWQFLSTTWNNYDGYPTAADAPEEVQDARAREVWNGGKGRGQWVCK